MLRNYRSFAEKVTPLVPEWHSRSHTYWYYIMCMSANKVSVIVPLLGVHSRCQLQYSPRLCKDAGMGALEVVETLHSFVRPFQQQLKRSTTANRQDLLNFMIVYFNEFLHLRYPGMAHQL